eukprot:TRINITY_DN4115_c0_g1_i1.p1 TRINITY_DN4115_c0_g1~~TRINITY_DN4115_c0_g1_i1.p1  ORF type:complete len:423 (-),score=86.62 TRINITY_DN4115_c0_g1_i1:532-1800(-)
MGNRISIRKRSSRRPVEERFTRPKRFILEPTNVDYKKLRKLILSEKLAPCFDGVEESNPDLEECPICFFYFPSLNRSRCCMKGICTECFLQMKPSNSNRPVQCPFCKYSIYAVEYHGARTQAEKRLEQEEEQKVIEAKIRMQVEESQEMNRETLADQILPGAEVQSPLPYVWQQPNHGGNDQGGRYTQLSFTPERAEAARARHEDFDVDLEEIMVAEAIWLSMQETSLSQSSGPSGTARLDNASHGPNGSRSSLGLNNQGEVSSTESVTGGLAFAIARFAEQNIQHSVQSVVDNDNANQTTDENFAEEDDSSTQRTVSPNEVGSEIGCLESSLTTDDDSWGSLAASPLEEHRTSEIGFVSDEDLVEEINDVASCSASSIHSISDGSCGSADCSDDDVDASCSHLSANTAVHRPLVVIPDIRS